MNRKHLLVVLIYANSVQWLLGWQWGYAAALFGLGAIWLCSSVAK